MGFTDQVSQGGETPQATGVLLHELSGIGVELSFAAARAEVVRFSVVLAAARGLRRVYLHPADDVFFHARPP